MLSMYYCYYAITYPCKNVVYVFLLLRYHLPLEKGMALNLIHLKKFESPLPKDGLNRTSGQRERERERETDRQTDRQTGQWTEDNIYQKAIKNAPLSFQLR